MAHILLLLDSSGDQRLLTEFLGQRHEVIQPDEQLNGPQAILADSDMAIAGWLTLQRVWPELKAKRQSVSPLLWPVLLVVSADCIGQVDQQLWECIDELIATPIRQAELENRIGVLLRSQQLSLELTTVNQRLRERNTQLEELNRLKSQFVSMVSHEFRNPLGVVSGYVQLLQSRGGQLAAAQQQDYLNRIQDTLKRLKTLVDDVLIIGRVGVGKLSYTPAPFDLIAFCRRLAGEIQFSNPDPCTLDLQIDAQCEADLQQVYMDEKLLRHILSNLLINAVKYSPTGAPVIFRLECDAHQIKLQVQDQGIGIPDSDQPHLFEPFRRASNVSDISGTGLGLAIVKQCVELHGGVIQFESQINQGSTFTITLPYRETA